MSAIINVSTLKVKEMGQVIRHQVFSVYFYCNFPHSGASPTVDTLHFGGSIRAVLKALSNNDN